MAYQGAGRIAYLVLLIVALPRYPHAAVALICLHLIVGVVLIMGFMRFVPRPYQRTGQAVDHPHYGG